ncbi:lactate utilization protein C [Mariniflexile sp. AS56]|uniref:LutC/YkgG family protein n=1 Tax=Mariniflexile sp. AS56 TaxID=3063957 RepID=UPI0026F21609|nr:LUD domain-containing protein [Mariniflexile sp. AS56]MDO7172441.1 LUD domain-containing protein [Mariniflexile sp. AS56]
MSSRDHILSRIKAHKPEFIEEPVITLELFMDWKHVKTEFTMKVEIAGGQVFEATSNQNVTEQVSAMFPESKVNFSTLKGTDGFNTINLDAINKPHDLEDLDILILESGLGVAENGAVWIKDSQLPMRVLPFITKHLVVVLRKDAIVTFMHQAYRKLSCDQTDFGVFISGPSKTADIEQSLVIGAHGALSMSVFLV